VSHISQLSPELGRGVLQLARALLVAARNWTLYPPEHPTVGLSVTRLRETIEQSSLGSAFSIGITPDTLMVENAAADATQVGIAEAAALLHDRDLIAITFVTEVPDECLRAFLRLLALDPAERRAQGGPAKIWQEQGHASLVLQQIDYARVLARDQRDVPSSARRDDLWRSIVISMAGGQQAAFDEQAQERLLAIAGSPVDIADLATAVSASKCTADGSPMLSTQAATVLAAFRHLNGVVTVMSPERVPELMNNLASAARQLDPNLLMQLLLSEDLDEDATRLVRELVRALDDETVAELLSKAVATQGTASDRIAAIFHSTAPDQERRQRVLTMTRKMLRQSDVGTRQFETLSQSMDELLTQYNDEPYVSVPYRAALEGLGGRAERMAIAELPADLTDWIDTLGQENIRRLSVTMLIDLLSLERDAKLAAQVAEDMETLAEDLLLSGAYDDALNVTRALAARGATPDGVGRDACRAALDRLGESLAMRETSALIGDVDEASWTAIRAVMRTVGVSTIEALKPVVMTEDDTLTTTRAEDTIVAFGAPAVGRLAELVGDPRWFAQRRAARLLGRIAVPDAVPLLQPLLRQGDPRVAREAVTALGRIHDPAAARAIQIVLRASTGTVRRAVIDALVEGRDHRVVPLLVELIAQSRALGRDREVVLEMIAALAIVGSENAVPILIALARRRAWFARARLRALKEASVRALTELGGERARSALRDAAENGDRMLRKIVTARTQGRVRGLTERKAEG
jgi:HEAT repeat protein